MKKPLSRILMLVLVLSCVPFPAFAAVSAQGDDSREKAAALLLEGDSLYDRGDFQAAINQYAASLILDQEIEDRSGEGQALTKIGIAYYALKQYEDALDYFQRALPIRQEIGDRVEEANTLSNIGRVYLAVHQSQQALDYLQQAFLIRQELDDREGAGRALNDLGMAYFDLGQYEEALHSFQQALTIRQDLGDRAGEGMILTNIGAVYERIGQYAQALDYFQRALPILQEMGFRADEARTLTNFGVVYDVLGQYEQALDYFQRALPIMQEMGDRLGEGTALNNIGEIYRSLGQYEQALDYFQQALKIRQEIDDRLGEVANLNNIGSVYNSMGQYGQALDYYQRALAVSQAIEDRYGEGTMLSNIGSVYNSLGQYGQALDYYQQALPILQDIGDQDGEATALNNMGWQYEKQNDKAQAIIHYRQAVMVIESIQDTIKVEEFKASFVAERVGAYEHLISLLWDEGQFQEAFNFAERARARAFLDQLAGGAIDFGAGMDADLLGSEARLRNEMAALRSLLFTLQNRPQSQWDTDAIATAQAQLTELEADYAHLLTDIKLQSPELAELVSVDVASLADIQSLLDSNTTLVEYFVMQTRTLAFIITRDSIETVAVDVHRDDLNRVINDFRDFASLEDPHPASLQQLNAWLIAPLKDKLTTSMIGIIPHGVLHYLPFAALTDGERYLSDDYILFTLPSASALRFLQEKRKPMADTILALGNPASNEPGLAPLQFAQQEVETIASMFGTQPLVSDSATESKLRSEAPSAGIIHLAAHGQYNSENPLFSVLYLAEDQQEDGRLEVHEIYNLNLTQATNLVVLSACETQVGAVSAGDEVVGMTRAFLYAGTPTVIASLWNVDDEATTLLMEHFYASLRNGMSKAQALQAAQSAVRAQYPHPYYWAAFVLTGDAGESVKAKSTPLPPVDNRMSPAVGIGALLVLGVGGLSMVAILAGVIVWRRRRKRVGS